MLVTLSLVGYAACAGATFMRFLQVYDLFDRPRARLLWLILFSFGVVLWPLTWMGFAVIAWLARHAPE